MDSSVIRLLIFSGAILFISKAFAQQTRTWNVYFAYGSAALSPQTRAVLDTLPVDSAAVLSVYGHTDAHGTDAYNEALADRRAAAVANYLAHRHPQAPVAFRHVLGETQPVALNEVSGADNPGGRQQNRRVSIVATYTTDKQAIPAVSAVPIPIPIPPAPVPAPSAPDPANCACLLQPRTETFTLRTDVEQTATGAKGTRLLIEPGTFTIGGQPVTGEVQLTLTEAYTYDDMLRNNLSTITTDGQLLETGGMFRVEVMQNGRSVDTEVRKPILFTMPQQNPNMDMQLFYGAGHDSHENRSVYWQQAEVADTTVGGWVGDFWDDVVVSALEKTAYCYRCSRIGVTLPENPFMTFYDMRTPREKRADSLAGRQNSFYHPDSAHFRNIMTGKMRKIGMKEIKTSRMDTLSIEDLMRIMNEEKMRAKVRAVLADSAYQQRVQTTLKDYRRLQQGNEDITITLYGNMRFAITDKSYFIRMNGKPDKSENQISAENENSVKKNFIGKLNKIDWVNCDRFSGISPSRMQKEIMIVPGTNVETAAFICIKKYRSLISGMVWGESLITPLVPKNCEATLVVLRFEGKEVKAAMLPITTGTAERYTLTPGSHSLEEVLTYLKSY